MRKYKIMLFTAILIVGGCTVNDSSKVTKLQNENTVQDDNQYSSYLVIVNNYELEREERVKSLEKLKELGYPYYKELIENLQDDGVLREDILKFSLLFWDFKYSKDNTIRVLQENFENKKYNKFIELYSENIDIVSRSLYNEKEKEFLKIGEEISDKEDIVYNLEQENEEAEKKIRKFENKIIKKELENTVQIIEGIKSEIEILNSKRAAVKLKIENNPDNLQLQQDLKNINEMEKKQEKELAKANLKAEEIKESLMTKEIADLKDKIKNNGNKKSEIRANIREKKDRKDEIGKELSVYEENLIASKEEIRDFFKNVKYNSENIKSVIKFAVKSDEYENFEIAMNSSKNIEKQTSEGIKEEWIYDYFTQNREEFIKIRNQIKKENYFLFKRTTESILETGKKNEKKAAVTVILENETDYSDKIVNKHIELQSEAIKRFGVEESVQYLRARLNSDKSNELIIFRGLVLSGDVEIFETLKKRYEKTKNLDYLEDIYILKNNLTRDYVKLKLSEIDNKLKSGFINREYISEMEETDMFVYELLIGEENPKARMLYLEYISKYSKDLMVKSVLKLIELDKISSEERSFIVLKLKENSGEDTTQQILKSLEKTVYAEKVEEEKERIAFSAKIEFWNDYLKEFSDSLFKEEISNKIKIYEARVDTIKATIKNDYKIQIEEIDKKISEYNDYIKEQSDLGRIGYFQGKINELEKNKLLIIKNSKKTIIETMKELEKSYKNISDEIQGVTVYLNSKSSDILTREERERQKMDLNKLNVKQAETLEKIAILYGFYLEENKGNEEKNIFGREVTRALKGNR